MSKELVSSQEIYNLAQQLHTLRSELADLNQTLQRRKDRILNLWEDKQGEAFAEIIKEINSINAEADDALYDQLEQLRNYYENLVQAENLKM